MSYRDQVCREEGCNLKTTSPYCRKHRPMAIAFRANPDDPRHGSVNGYSNLGCKCDPCKAAWKAAHWRYMQANPEQYEKGRVRGNIQRWGGPGNLAEQGYMRTRTVARIFDVHAATIQTWADEGLLPVRRYTPGGHRAFHPQDVADLAAAHVAEGIAAFQRQFGALVDFTVPHVAARKVAP